MKKKIVEFICNKNENSCLSDSNVKQVKSHKLKKGSDSEFFNNSNETIKKRWTTHRQK